MGREILIEELKKISHKLAEEGCLEIAESVDDDYIILRFSVSSSIFYTDKNEKFKVPITKQRKITLRQAKAYIIAFQHE